MPSWHRYVLLGAIAVASVGVVGHVRQFTGANGGGPDTSGQNSSSSPQPIDSAGAVPNAQPWYLSPRFLSIGGSVIGGFVIGWLMRIFVRTTISIGLLITLVIGGLSYFHILNVDLTSVQQRYSGDVSWAADQASRLKDVAMAYLPVHAGGLFGVFLGFRRGRV